MNNARSSTTSGTEGDEERHSLQAYVSDLLALEQHIAKPLEEQVDHDATSQYPRAAALFQQLKNVNESHVQRLQGALDRLGGHPASPIKSAWSGLLGGAAAAIGASRKTKVTKWLRDDYAALNLAAMSYTLLHATAVGIGDSEIAELARTGLADYARAVMEINQVVPEIVLGELREQGVDVPASAAEAIRQQTESIWRTQGASLHGNN